MSGSQFCDCGAWLSGPCCLTALVGDPLRPEHEDGQQEHMQPWETPVKTNSVPGDTIPCEVVTVSFVLILLNVLRIVHNVPLYCKICHCGLDGNTGLYDSEEWKALKIRLVSRVG